MAKGGGTGGRKGAVVPKSWTARKKGGFFRQTKYGYARVESTGDGWKTTAVVRSGRGPMFGASVTTHPTRAQALKAGNDWLRSQG